VGGLGGGGGGLEPGGGSRGASLGGLGMRVMFNLFLIRKPWKDACQRRWPEPTGAL